MHRFKLPQHITTVKLNYEDRTQREIHIYIYLLFWIAKSLPISQSILEILAKLKCTAELIRIEKRTSRSWSIYQHRIKFIELHKIRLLTVDGIVTNICKENIIRHLQDVGLLKKILICECGNKMTVHGCTETRNRVIFTAIFSRVKIRVKICVRG